MTAQPLHYAEELQDLLDGRLAEPRRAEVAAHVESCPRCRKELAALEWVKREALAVVGESPMPVGLTARVRATLDAEDQKTRPVAWRRRTWVAAVALAAAALVVVFVRTRDTATLPELAADDFRAFDAGTAPLAIESADPKVVQAWFARNGAPFVTRVIDLGMMQYRLAGGRVHRLGAHTSALFAYRGPGNVALVCEMYEGRTADLPPVADVREHDGITFRVYRVENLTLVFWQEGDVVCVLASSIPLEEVVQLAFAKAVRIDRSAD